MKLDFVLEQLASASVGSYGPDVWSELVEEAKTNLMKITVSVAVLFLKRFLSNLTLHLQNVDYVVDSVFFFFFV